MSAANIRPSWLADARTRADADPAVYGDVGQWDTVLYRLTGDAARGRRAVEKVLRGLDGAAPGLTAEPTWGPNETRETTIEWAVRYADLLPVLSEPDRALWRERLTYRASLILSPVGSAWGTRVSDSDQTVGHYLGLCCIDRALGTSYLTKTAADLPAGATPPAAMREALARFCQLARGGEWIESSEYNVGTLQLLVMGHLFAGPFPEITAILPAVADQCRRTLVPGLGDAVPWGDVENGGRDFKLWNRMALLCLLAQATGDANGRLRELIAWYDRDGPGAWWFGLPRPLRWFDLPLPPTPTDPPTDPALDGFHNALDVGLATYRTGPLLVAVSAPNPLAVDHQVPSANVLVWYDGAPLLDANRGYVMAPEGLNTALLAGINGLTGLLSEFGQVEAAATPGGFRVVWRTGGPYGDGRGDKPPLSTFCDEWRREVEWDGARLIVNDRFQGRPPPDPDSYRDDVKAMIAGRDALWCVVWQVTGEPTEIAPGVWRWLADDGRVVTLTATGHSGVRLVAPHKIGGYLPDSEWSRFWQVRLLSDAGTATIRSELTFAGITPPVPPPPVPMPPPPPVPPSPVVRKGVIRIGGLVIPFEQEWE